MSRYIDIEPYEKDGWYLQKTYYSTYGAGIKTTPLISIPTAEADPFKAFAEWVASEVCNEGFEEMWTLGAFAEVACRKLYALGIVQKFRDEWVYVDKDELDEVDNETT